MNSAQQRQGSSSFPLSWRPLRLVALLAWVVVAAPGCLAVQLSPQEHERLAQRVADLVTERLANANAATRANLPPDPFAALRDRVKVEDGPYRGADEPLVTIVVFSDFECPFCSRVLPTLERVMDEHAEQVRLVFRHNPLPMHRRAAAAAAAAIEAYRQGGNAAFWAMHDRLFAEQRRLDQESLLSHTRSLGLNVDRMRRALEGGTHAATIERDQGYARDLEARGTPTFFINGRKLAGAQPYEMFEGMVSQEITLAERLMAAGLPRADLYQTLMAGPDVGAGQEAEADEEIRVEAAEEPDVYVVPIPDDVPSLGPDDAAVTVQIFSDFECPFCSRVLPTLERLRNEHPELRFVHRNYPLPFHPHAQLAHEAAWEVYEQGGDEKFWAFHDVLFENRENLEEADLQRYAARLGGISMARFRRALSERRHRDRIEADVEAVREAGARIGTPSFLVNGRLLQGAQPYHRFRDLIQEVQEAEADAP